jgi:hypothetical protein
VASVVDDEVAVILTASVASLLKLFIYSQHFIFFLPFKMAKKARVLHYIRLEKLVRDKHSSLSGPCLNNNKTKSPK